MSPRENKQLKDTALLTMNPPNYSGSRAQQRRVC